MARLSRDASGSVPQPLGVALSMAVSLWAGVAMSVPAESVPTTGDAYTVERRNAPEHEQDTLPFLRANRDFFRARLDELRTALREDWKGAALEIEPDWLRWQEMLREIGAARDSAAASEEWIRRQQLLDSVASLVDLEHEMDEMESLLDSQVERLARLEEDFSDGAHTGLVVLLTGVSSLGAPRTVVLWDGDGRPYRVHLSPPVRASLERGGSVELIHRLVEPRAQRWDLAVEGDAWSEMLPVGFELDPARHRLTFLEVDLEGLAATRAGTTDGNGTVFRQWVR